LAAGEAQPAEAELGVGLAEELGEDAEAAVAQGKDSREHARAGGSAADEQEDEKQREALKCSLIELGGVPGGEDGPEGLDGGVGEVAPGVRGFVELVESAPDELVGGLDGLLGGAGAEVGEGLVPGFRGDSNDSDGGAEGLEVEVAVEYLAGELDRQGE
jgi:hypothetical protein